MVLALAVERALSKSEILSSYIGKIYWGRGIHGIESASDFYFRKHPSHLSLGESAMLAVLIPAPELQSPFRDCVVGLRCAVSSGKTFQARVLKRMVEVGFINVDRALLELKQPLPLCDDLLQYADQLVYFLQFTRKELREVSKLKQGGGESTKGGMGLGKREQEMGSM